jgi:hypothetical protein
VNDYLDELTKTVRKRHGQEAEYMRTVMVKEMFGGNNVWDGAVEVFGLRWNPKAKRCYAWGQPNDEGGWDVISVLEVHPIISPHTAVKAIIAAKARLAKPSALGVSV